MRDRLRPFGITHLNNSRVFLFGLIHLCLQSSVHDRDIFNEEGFKTPSTPEQCLTYNFHVDSSTDILGSQVSAPLFVSEGMLVANETGDDV